MAGCLRSNICKSSAELPARVCGGGGNTRGPVWTRRGWHLEFEAEFYKQNLLEEQIHLDFFLWVSSYGTDTIPLWARQCNALGNGTPPLFAAALSVLTWSFELSFLRRPAHLNKLFVHSPFCTSISLVSLPCKAG